MSNYEANPRLSPAEAALTHSMTDGTYEERTAAAATYLTEYAAALRTNGHEGLADEHSSAAHDLLNNPWNMTPQEEWEEAELALLRTPAEAFLD